MGILCRYVDKCSAANSIIHAAWYGDMVLGHRSSPCRFSAHSYLHATDKLPLGSWSGCLPQTIGSITPQVPDETFILHGQTGSIIYVALAPVNTPLSHLPPTIKIGCDNRKLSQPSCKCQTVCPIQPQAAAGSARDQVARDAAFERLNAMRPSPYADNA